MTASELSLTCPFCGGTLYKQHLSRHEPFICPTCKAELQLARGQLTLTNIISWFVSAALGVGLGLRGVWLLGIVALWFPVMCVVTVFYKALVPGRLEPYVPKGGLSGWWPHIT